MDIKDIPIRAIGPGSQPLEEDGTQLEYINLPQDMHKYRQPELPEPEAVQHLKGAWEAMDWIQQALNHYRVGDEPLMADLTHLDAKNRSLVNQVLGEGEVSVRYNDVIRARMQESVLAGVWRTFYLNDDDKPIRDLVEVSDVPFLAKLPSRGELRKGVLPTVVENSPDIMNAKPLLTEIRERQEQYQSGQPAHVINLTLLPITKEDTDFLDNILGQGTVSILSRSYGKCQVLSTKVPNVWWVRYFNSVDTLILNTVEIVDIPLVACAAQEDIQNSEERLRDILTYYR